MFSKRLFLLAGALAVITGTIFYLESLKTERDKSVGDTSIIPAIRRGLRVPKKEGRFERAKEISSPDAFINAEPFTLDELIGKQVILVDFWTYSCVNCKRTIPHLNAWQERYGKKGLTIIGLHTPEFEFEKKLENVKRAVEKFGIKYPVVLDNDYSTWQAYRNQYWPRKYLIDIDGFIVYDRIGEGGYEETEEKIVELLNERSEALNEEAVAKIEMLAKGAETSAPADIYLDGKLINSIEVQAHDLYTLVDLEGKYETHLLEIRFKKSGVGAYAFTFG